MQKEKGKSVDRARLVLLEPLTAVEGWLSQHVVLLENALDDAELFQVRRVVETALVVLLVEFEDLHDRALVPGNGAFKDLVLDLREKVAHLADPKHGDAAIVPVFMKFSLLHEAFAGQYPAY